MWGRLATQCRSFFPRPDTCKNRGTEIDERDHAKTRLCVERLERPALPAEIAGQKTSGIGLTTCAAVDYRRRPAANAAVGRLTIGRSLPSCPTRSQPGCNTVVL